ncbi:MAG: hypothetical protein CMJ65_16710 [Planctomycetaceae bacterium]|jgi:mono/diheme cytochrome c family protein|nr:hypothetical protein [Planctomycetaceae bacterium]
MRILLALPLLLLPVAVSAADPPATPAQLEFFEKKVRPLLARHCYKCHGRKAKSLKGGLRLDQRRGAFKGGDSGAVIVAGQPDKSLLIRSIRYQALEMPPAGKLKPAEIDMLVAWIKNGAAWPNEPSTTAPRTPDGRFDISRARKTHWAYQPPTSPELPAVKNSKWGINEIDRFILARLEAAGLSAGPTADRRTLLRRVMFDLVGLPPTPQQVREFLDDTRPDAWARVIDRLLDSPHYGERWGRHWLDVARYSDGFGGYLDGAALPHAWRYRDWVVRSFNRDLPFDQFVRHQVAGDLIAGDPESHFGSGFFAVGPTYRSDGGDPDSVAQARSETLDDRVDALGRGFLALTIACARCHEHKFDPISLEDYYGLAGVFNNTRSALHPLAPPAQVKAFDLRQADIKRLDGQVKQLAKAGNKATPAQKRDLAAKQAELKRLRETAPPKYPVTHALADSGNKDMAIALRGNLRKPGKIVPRQFPRILAGDDAKPFTRGSGRLDLADALVNPSNPLTTRVFVNRVWKWHFGRGLVRTPSNFGTLGEEPTHPDLLTWLAAHLVKRGWSIKWLHRTILLSATYRQTAAFNRKAFSIDGDNRLVWRYNPRRLDVEAWRDSLLSVTGELDLAVGGPPTEDVRGSRRRTMYFRVSRTGDRFSTDHFLRLFDFPIPRASIAKRPRSTVPQQFLFLMNSPMMIDRARALVARLKKEKPDQAQRLERAYQLLFGRSPTPLETRLAGDFLETKTTVAGTPAAKSADILVSDFEGGNYGKWQATGTAFGPTPPTGTLPNQMNVSGFRGRGLVNTYFRGDKTTGTLTSPEFTIRRRRLAFLIGGGSHPGKTCIELHVDGRTVRSMSGQNNELLQWNGWDVSKLAGKTARIRIVDQFTGGWGHINIDHIVQTNHRQVATAPVQSLDPWTQYLQVLLSSNEFMFVR